MPEPLISALSRGLGKSNMMLELAARHPDLDKGMTAAKAAVRETHRPRVQAESWADATARHVVVVVQSHRAALACVATRPHGSAVPMVAALRLAPCRFHHDRAAVLAAAEPGLPSVGDMADMGLFGREPDFAKRVEAYLNGYGGDLRPQQETYMVEGATSYAVRGRVFRPGQDRMGEEWNRRNMAPATHGYPQDVDRRLSAPVGPCADPVVAAARGEAPPGTLVFGATWDGTFGTLNNLLSRTLGTLVDGRDRQAAALLGPKGWTASAHAFYVAAGEAGERRRQAAALYPALAPLIAHDAGVSAAVDAGRPFEEALRSALGRMLPPDEAGRLTVAKLRRMRTLPVDGFTTVRISAHLAACLPVDWLPSDAAGWGLLRNGIGQVLGEVGVLGLEPRDLLAHVRGDWHGVAASSAPELRPPGDDNPNWEPVPRARSVGAVHAVNGATDMASRLADTLVSQVLESMGADSRRPVSLRVAARILFAGKALPAVDRLQLGWHKGLSRLDAALPAPGDNAWPALFAPFAAPNGLEVRFLTDEAQLKAEGADVQDAEGVAGLDHCVGGYGRDCFEGRSHVASVRRPLPGGSFERVSTVEFSYRPDNGLLAWRAGVPPEGARTPPGTLSVEQHLARFNGTPSEEAEEAVRALVARFDAGGIEPAPEAVRPRERGAYRDSYDWREPGKLAQAFRAWRPYLPREVARGGLPALLERVARETGCGAAPDPDGDRTEA